MIRKSILPLLFSVLLFGIVQLAPELQPVVIELEEQVLGLQSEQAPTTSTEALVTRVIDGDTIELSSGEKVRYIGIDTPELSHPARGKECFAEAATEKNKALVLGKIVRLEKDVSETDRYGRLLRYVWINDEMVNRTLVSEGYAFASSYPPDVAYQALFMQDEQQARSQLLGIWESCEFDLTVQ